MFSIISCRAIRSTFFIHQSKIVESSAFLSKIRHARTESTVEFSVGVLDSQDFLSISKRNLNVSAVNTMTSNENNNGVISLDEARRFMVDCFTKSNTNQPNAQAMADLLAEADYRGHYSHGMNRLEMYINDLHINSTDGNVMPLILNETPSTAWVDGLNGLGAVVGNFCMDLAIEKAKTTGVGVVCAKRSNHYGIAGWYTLRAMEKGFIGISATNTSPLMCPTRAMEAGLGTNPISFAAPADKNDSFVLDMATTAVAVGKIEIQRRKGEPVPAGWAYDTNGKITTDADIAFESGCLAPLGGEEVTSGYKGYGMGAMVEVLCGILAGANFSTKIRKWTHSGSDSEANLGQFFMALDPKCFAPGFTGRLSEMNDILRNLTPTDPSNPVLIAGDPERIHMKKVDSEGGVRYTDNQIKACQKLSERLGVSPIKFNS
ncbi:CLUMA_CG015751, isoform A [Clunio marinus]|uniref:CLUMA_CG015751, isoform A n=1 Tax=Clunio marinus TaxID=568069 RepID=A0A1J1IRZ0_9DIPT|nr:CLUMA_CG015751, isoform A [Clunio marinus]